MPRQSPQRSRRRFFAARPSVGVVLAWLALVVAMLASTIVVTSIRSVSLGIGLDRVQGMSWMALYAATAVVAGGFALVLLRWPRTIKGLLGVALVSQLIFVRWVAGHDGTCVFGCGPSVAQDNSASVAVYQYMCCATTDVDREYHPGDTVVLHWSAIAAPAPAHDRLVTLSAGLLGPFDDIDTLRSLAPLHDGHIKVKVAGGHVDATLAARGSQVTRITIPTGTPPGYYALETSAGPAVGDPCWAQQTCEEGHQNAPMVVRVSS